MVRKFSTVFKSFVSVIPALCSSGCDIGEDIDDPSIGVVVAITLTICLLVFLPVGVAIGSWGTWFTVRRTRERREGGERIGSCL